MGEQSTTIEVKARKRHRCTWCGEQIPAGTRYKTYTYFGDDGPVRVKLHPECHAAMLRWFDLNHEYEFDAGIFTRGCVCEGGDPGHGTYPDCTPKDKT